MKVLRKMLNIISLVLLLAGALLLLYTFLTNRTFVNKLSSLLTNAECKKGMLFTLIGFICLVFAFVLFSVSVRISSSIRRKEKEQAAAEKARLDEEARRTKELEREAAEARAEAERLRASATQSMPAVDNGGPVDIGKN